MKFNRIAVFTDNPNILGRFIEVINAKKIDKNAISYYCSIYSNVTDFKRIEINIKQKDIKKKYKFFSSNFDLIISLHCKQIFPPDLVNKVKCINIHPGYNPINRGWYPQVFAILENINTGATIHEMDQMLDHGKIIARKKVEKYNWDTSLSLYNRIVDAEFFLLNEYIENILNNNYSTLEPEDEGKIYLKNDFNELLEIDLNKTGTFKFFIDYLRALSHGDFKNAYFMDSDGKRIYVKILLEPEK